LRVDEPLYFARHPTGLVEIERFEDFAQQSRLIFRIQDLETLRQACLAPVQAQQAVRESVKSTDPHRAAGIPSKVSMRPRISAAALLVKVTARMLFGDVPSTWISQATR